MAYSLYDVSVGTYLQMLQGTLNILDKAEAHYATAGSALDETIDLRLCDDMLPLSFQLRSVAHHSLGCIRGLQAGLFQPPPEDPGLDFAGLKQLVANAHSELSEMDAAEVNALSGRPMLFKMGKLELPFTTDNFVTSFSLPNFYFHVTTTYNLLRQCGVKLGKADYMGPMKLGQ